MIDDEKEETEIETQADKSLTNLRNKVKKKVEGLNGSAENAVAYDLLCKIPPSKKFEYITTYFNDLPDKDDIAKDCGGGDFMIQAKINKTYAGSASFSISKEIFGDPSTWLSKLKKENGKTNLIEKEDDDDMEKKELIEQLKQTQEKIKSMEQKQEQATIDQKIADLKRDIEIRDQRILDAINSSNKKGDALDDIERLERLKKIMGGGDKSQVEFMGNMFTKVLEFSQTLKQTPVKDIDGVLADFAETFLDKFKNNDIRIPGIKKTETAAPGAETTQDGKEKMSKDEADQKIKDIAIDFIKQIYIGYKNRLTENYFLDVINSKVEFQVIKEYLKKFPVFAIVGFLDQFKIEVGELNDPLFIQSLTPILTFLKKNFDVTPPPPQSTAPGNQPPPPNVVEQRFTMEETETKIEEVPPLDPAQIRKPGEILPPPNPFKKEKRKYTKRKK